MLNFIFGRPDLQQAAEHNRRMAQQQAGSFQFSQPNVFENCYADTSARPEQTIDLIEIDGVWQLPRDTTQTN
jgi:hypothetical protein